MVNLSAGIFRGLEELSRFFSIKKKLKSPHLYIVFRKAIRAVSFFSSSLLIKRKKKKGIHILPLEREVAICDDNFLNFLIFQWNSEGKENAAKGQNWVNSRETSRRN